MRKLFTIPAILLVLLMIAACNATPEQTLPDDGPSGTVPVNPNQIQPGKVFHSFSIEPKTGEMDVLTEDKVTIHLIRPAESTGAWLVMYADDADVFIPVDSFIISAMEQDAVIKSTASSSAADMLTLDYDETGEAEFVIDVAASTKGTLTVTISDFNDENNSITLNSELPANAGMICMGFQPIQTETENIPFPKMEVFKYSHSHKPDLS